VIHYNNRKKKKNDNTITIEDILTESCAAKHEFEYLGIVRVDAITVKDVRWSKCNKCGLDKFKSTSSPRYDAGCF
jgi:hypothetical protein